MKRILLLLTRGHASDANCRYSYTTQFIRRPRRICHSVCLWGSSVHLSVRPSLLKTRKTKQTNSLPHAYSRTTAPRLSDYCTGWLEQRFGVTRKMSKPNRNQNIRASQPIQLKFFLQSCNYYPCVLQNRTLLFLSFSPNNSNPVRRDFSCLFFT